MLKVHDLKQPAEVSRPGFGDSWEDQAPGTLTPDDPRPNRFTR